MGLFDIFKRKATKPEEPKPVESETSEAPLTASEESAISSDTSVDKTSVVEPESSSNVEAQQSSEVDSQTAASTESLESESMVSKLASQETSTIAEQSESLASEDSNESSETETSKTPVEVDSTETSDEPEEPVADEPEDSVTEEPAVAEHEEATYEKGLEKTRSTFGSRLNEFLANFRSVDEDFFEELEETLIKSDVGFDMAVSISDQLRDEVKLQNAKSKQAVSNVIIEKLVQIYDDQGKDEDNSIHFAAQGPTVILFVGVNGVGKTTTIGKMAAKYKQQGKKVLLAAADTFRAGATKQLQVWGDRDGVEVVTGPEGSDPASVVFDAVDKAKKENYDVLFVDTAGRLQNKVNLMNELEKMKRIIEREIAGAPQEVLLVLDSTTGQNALTQAKMFKSSTDVTGIVLTKLDGTARGGIVLAIRNELHLPVKFVGLGEQVADLQEFDASEYVYGLFKGLVTEEG
ncbi:signal recognition particle-docking protein FtsY [Paucilactobacillus nenjiangensis]|uniref:signal recognition particle-docking protein FtsY n=1 Tax=Paucilactobacillus nenjiangensis TaxID=1296540 RepID=UPI0028D330FB|nr:signal recognition particle-docking protein FtsY [Paucilactobacillus nenjiangensis]